MKEEIKDNKSKLYGAIIFIIGLVLICVGVVIQFTGKSSSPTTPTDVDTPQDNPSDTQDTEELDDTVYEITETDEFTNANGDIVIKEITKTEDGYSINYNGQVGNMVMNQEDNIYLSLSGDFEGGGQCFSNHFLLNKKTKTIEDIVGISINFIRTTKGYFFISGKCEPLDYPGDVYDSNWNLLGMYLGNAVLSNGNIFVSKHDGTSRAKGLMLYNVNGMIVSELDEYYFTKALIYNDECYAIALNDGKVYIFNLSTNEKVEITDISSNRDLSYSFYDGMELDGEIIHLSIEEGNFDYNITTKEVTNS